MAEVYGPKIVRDGLVLYLDAADKTSYPGSGTTWSDRSTTGNNGTLINGPAFDFGNGGSIVFDGVNDYVNLGIASNLTNPSTVCAFVNTALITGARQVIYGPTANGQDNWISVTNNRIELFATQASDVNNINITGTTFIEINKWYYVTGIVNNNIIQVYINGEFEVGTSPQAFTIGGWNSAARIGQRATGQFPFNGRIACIQGYNRALTAQEIQQNYNATKTRFGL